jgi:hypothetical protein
MKFYILKSTVIKCIDIFSWVVETPTMADRRDGVPTAHTKMNKTKIWNAPHQIHLLLYARLDMLYRETISINGLKVFIIIF